MVITATIYNKFTTVSQAHEKLTAKRGSCSSDIKKIGYGISYNIQ